MTSNHDNTNPSNEEDGAFIGIPPDHLLNYLAHLAEGNLIALVRLTAVVEHLRTTAKDLPADDETAKAIRLAVSGLSLSGLVLAKQGQSLSQHEDSILAALKAKGRETESIQAEKLNAVFKDHAAAGKAWLDVDTNVSDTPTPKPKDEPPSGGRGGVKWSPDGRLN
jgi:hypothetical protein